MTASAAARARLKWGNRCRWLVLGAREEPALSVTGGTTAAGPGRTHNTSSWWFLITSYLKQFTRKLQASLLPPASPMMRSSASMVRRPVWEATLVRSLLGNLSYFHICICSLWSLLKLTVVHFPGWCASERLHLMSLIYNLQLLLCSLEDDQASWSPWRQDSRSRIRRDWPIIREPAFYSRVSSTKCRVLRGGALELCVVCFPVGEAHYLRIARLKLLRVLSCPWRPRACSSADFLISVLGLLTHRL